MAINALNIPTNVGPQSYSGLGSAYQGFNTDTVIPLLQKLLGGYSGNVNSAYDNASSGLGALTKNTITPAIQQVINSLAGKNMLNSSVASDTMSNTISGLSNNLLSNQTSLAGDKASALTTGYNNLLTNAAGLGQYSSSTDNSTPYKIMAQLLQSMM
jgi:hypothetical protein